MELLTMNETCRMLGCTDPKGRFVRRLRAEGKIIGAKIGRNLMFDKRSVEDYIQSEFRKQNPKIKGRLTPSSETKFNSTQTSTPL